MDEVVAGGEALDLLEPGAGEVGDAGVEDVELAVMLEDAAGPAAVLVGTAGGGGEGDGELFPVGEVCGDGMAPVLDAGVGDAGAVLEEEVIGAVPEEGLWVVDPAGSREEVEGRAVRVLGGDALSYETDRWRGRARAT